MRTLIMLTGWLLAGNIHPLTELAGSIRIYSIEFLDKQSPMNCGVGGVDGGVSRAGKDYNSLWLIRAQLR